MANNFFQKEIMASESVLAYNRSLKYEVAATPTVATQGMIVKMTDPVTNIWGDNDLSTYKAVAPVADTDPIYILDILESPFITSGNKTYRVGVELSNITAPADVAVRGRKPKLDDIFLIGADNFVSAPTVGEYAIPTAGDTKLTPSGSISTTKFCVEIKEAVTKSFGVSSSVSCYRCRVVTAN
jgi:hypothetical protein